MMWPTSSNDPNQWSFNPAVYQNVPYEQVDWATLAQQWIKMKETLPSASPGPPPPPAPLISKPKEIQQPKSTPAAPEARPTNDTNDIEGGEAPMDMDTKDDDVLPTVGVAADASWKQWNDWQSQYGWGWQRNAGTVTLGEKITTTSSTIDSKVKSQSNDSNPVLNNYVSNVGNFPNNKGTNSTPQVPGSINYNKVAGGMIPPTHPKSDYWNENSYSATGKSTGSKLGNKNSSQKPIAEQFPVMDAAKKKTLPAWIRDGLNKMEREKQKKIEYERMVQEKLMRDQISPEKSFKNDSFVGNNEAPVRLQSPPMAEKVVPSFDRFEKNHSLEEVETPRFHRSSAAVESTEIIRKTKDQIMEESMLKVRRILTEFLLEATENEVINIAKEEFRRKKSASAPQIRKSNALTSLTGNLGLAVYDSDSQSSDSEKENNDRDIDSDEELETLIEKKRRDFTLIEDQIEEEIESQEMRERQIIQRDQKLENVEDSHNSSVREREIDNDRSQELKPHPNEDEHGDKKNEKSNYVASEKTSNDKQEKSSKNSKSKKEKKRARSSSTTSSSFESSSTTSSDGSSSDRTHSRSNSSSSGSREKSRKKSRRKNDSSTKSRKRSKHRLKSRSTSRSRYSRNDKSLKDSKDRREKSSERKSARDYRKKSDRDSYHSRSSSYRRDSKDSSSSKYKDSRKSESSDSKRKRRRSSSVDSRYSRYKRR